MKHQYKHAPIIGWSPKELTWLTAALTLPAFEFICALDDIASMSGRTIGAIAAKAKALRREALGRAMKTPGILLPVPAAYVIRPPTMAQLMGAR